MINSKKIAMLLTCALLGAAVFAGCGKKDKAEETAAAAESTEAADMGPEIPKDTDPGNQ